MNIKAVGIRIRLQRKIKGLTQEELGKKANLSTMSIRRYENGDRLVSEANLQQIALALDISVNELLGITTENVKQKMSKETIFLNYLSSLGCEYSPDYENPDGNGVDRAIYWKTENITIPLTKKEYEDLRENINDDVLSELRRLKKQKNL